MDRVELIVFCCLFLLLSYHLTIIAGEQIPDPKDQDQCKCPDERPKYVHQNQGKGLCCKQSEEYDAVNHKCGFEPCPDERPYRDLVSKECKCDPEGGDRPHFIEGRCTKCDPKGGPKVRYIAEGAEVTHKICPKKGALNFNKAFLEISTNDPTNGGHCACPYDYPHYVNNECIWCCNDKHLRTKFVPNDVHDYAGPGQCHCENEGEKVLKMENGQEICGMCPVDTGDGSSKSRFVPTPGDGDANFGTCECEEEYPHSKSNQT